MTDFEDTIERVSLLAKATCGNGEVCVWYNDAPNDMNPRWQIAAGNSSVAVSVAEAPIFGGDGDTLQQAVSNIKKKIAAGAKP